MLQRIILKRGKRIRQCWQGPSRHGGAFGNGQVPPAAHPRVPPNAPACGQQQALSVSDTQVDRVLLQGTPRHAREGQRPEPTSGLAVTLS